MYKNVAGQKIRVFAFDRATAAPVTGDAANITCKVSLDSATATALADVNPTETEDGYYLFDLAQSETNANTLDFYPESSSDGVQVVTAGHDRQTVISSSAAEAIATGYAGYFGASYFGGGSSSIASSETEAASWSMELAVGSTPTKAILCTADPSARTVRVVFESKSSRSDIATVENGSITKSTTLVEFVVPAAVTTVERTLWARVVDTANGETLASLIVFVTYGPSGD